MLKTSKLQSQCSTHRCGGCSPAWWLPPSSWSSWPIWAMQRARRGAAAHCRQHDKELEESAWRYCVKHHSMLMTYRSTWRFGKRRPPQRWKTPVCLECLRETEQSRLNGTSTSAQKTWIESVIREPVDDRDPGVLRERQPVAVVDRPGYVLSFDHLLEEGDGNRSLADVLSCGSAVQYTDANRKKQRPWRPHPESRTVGAISIQRNQFTDPAELEEYERIAARVRETSADEFLKESGMSDKNREALVLHLAGLSEPDIAGVLGISEAAATKRVQRALAGVQRLKMSTLFREVIGEAA